MEETRLRTIEAKAEEEKKKRKKEGKEEKAAKKGEKKNEPSGSVFGPTEDEAERLLSRRDTAADFAVLLEEQ